ncbi:ABC transporter permease [Tetragenococcus halophilus]|uniref:ABC transporter permease protein n=1 Tax=Tetragenococcus halophilus (strain DSM 20338 / JCM 20259 / NCIMB 9735 / NBRC 12172) TaxID=945021 RepID=A0AAN1SK02_TETHN|nr:ABC transporter permease [Tetragenococcus halophilus]QXN86702.1 ABC transporter permease [Tetragenococcus halophilus]RQD29646.1 ABC transporter permease [Tetragenococcus halophilus subsp. halophilus DSM 20339]WJS81780.1 ABC transporter permease [Tetragenococcus halophilus]BAK95624.1 putative ABC transporter permease protein [Tetragenococcus halophilus NBRC 12172]GBD58698.1 putative ABC transporter permease protein [Tetragenococcus halophilus subsp. halophilus]
MNDRNVKIRNILVPVLSVILGLVIGAILMAAFGFNPVIGYQSMINASLGNLRSIGETLRQATPLIFTALGFSIANSAGFFNIGLSGQALCGWVASVSLALVFPDLPKIILLPLCIIAGALAGALAAAVPGVLRAYFGTSEVIVTIMMNYIVLYLSTFILQDWMPESFRSSLDSSNRITENASLNMESLSTLFGGSRVNAGLFLALLGLVVVWFIMKKTTLGYEIRAVGLNPNASEYAGMSSKRTIILSMVLSGTFAGLGGVVEGLGTYQNFFVQTESLSIGFDGLAVSLLGAGTSIGILLSALLFSILQIGGLGMQTGAGVPFEIVNVVIALIIFFVAISYIMRVLLAKIMPDKRQEEVVHNIESSTDDQDGKGGGL